MQTVLIITLCFSVMALAGSVVSLLQRRAESIVSKSLDKKLESLVLRNADIETRLEEIESIYPKLEKGLKDLIFAETERSKQLDKMRRTIERLQTSHNDQSATFGLRYAEVQKEIQQINFRVQKLEKE